MIEPDAVFTAMSNSIRLRALLLLQAERELCVCELTHAIGAAQPAISRHLAHLREVGLVLDRREGLWIYYRLHPKLPSWVVKILRTTATGVAEQSPFMDDRTALAVMPNRPDAPRCA